VLIPLFNSVLCKTTIKGLLGKESPIWVTITRLPKYLADYTWANDQSTGDNEEHSQDEETAGILNSASKKNKTKAMEAQSKPWIKRLWSFGATTSTAETAQDRDVAEDEENPPRIGDIDVLEPVEEENEAFNPLALSAPADNENDPIVSQTANPQTLPLATTASNKSTKRKRSEARPDLYEQFGSDPETNPKRMKSTEKKAELSRKTKSKAKPPIVPAKKSNGERLPMPSQSTQPGIQKRGRGRPTKAKRFTNGGNLHLQPSSTEAHIPTDFANALPGDTEDISDILENPSPIKVTRVSPHHKIPRNTESLEGDDGLPDLPDLGQRPVRSDTPADFSASTGPAFNIKVIRPKLLASMLEKAKQVGYKLTRKSQELKLVKKPPKLYSTPAKQANRLLEVLNSSYIKLRDLKAAKNLVAIRAAYVAITDSIHALQAIKRNILSGRLGNPARGIDYDKEVPTRSLLTDLYFSILPKILESMVLGAEAYNDDGTIQRSSLEEFVSLIDIYCALAVAAIDQPKSHQPRADDIPPEEIDLEFRMQHPTKGIIPRMRELRENIKAELNTQAKKNPKLREAAAESERIREEQETTEELERRRKTKEIRRRQREDLARQRAAPVWGQLMKDEDARAEAKEVGSWAREQVEKARARKALLTQIRDVEDDVEADPFVDDPFEEQRVSIFGTNNNQQTRSRAWTNSEKTTFVDRLRAYNGKFPFPNCLDQDAKYSIGEDRYKRLAEEFQCSMDEIFAYAKEFQEAMDFAHGEGRYNGKEDEWTYDIWVEPYEGRNRR